MKKSVGIVLVNYNGEKFQNDCIRSIQQMTYDNYKIILVDNGSVDNSIKLVKENFENINIIETGENCGVAKGNNIGIKAALGMGCDYVLLLNNDTEVDANMLDKMMSSANEKTMVTCKMYYYDNNDRKDVIWCAGGDILWSKGKTVHFGENEIDNGQCDESKYINFTPTCCLLIHKSIFENIGFMDEKYFMYFDDTDFIVRAKKKGYKIWYEANAKLWHKVSSSSGGNESKVLLYYFNRNRLYFIDKFYKNKFIPKSYFYITRLIRIINYYFTNKELSKIIIEAIRDYKKEKMYIKIF